MSRIEGSGRADLFTIDPERIKIPTSGPLYDERSDLPVDENLIASILYYGQIQPIVVRKNGPDLEVVAGRQRQKAILEINRRARERGERTMKIQARLIRGTDAEHYGITIAENEIRRQDDPVIKAQKASRLLKFGLTVQDIATTYGVQPRAVEEWLSLTEVAPEVQAAIQSGEIAAGVGVALAELPRDEQAAKLEEMKAAAEDGKTVTVKQARREVGGMAKSGRPNRPPALALKHSARQVASWLNEICQKPIKEQFWVYWGYWAIVLISSLSFFLWRSSFFCPCRSRPVGDKLPQEVRL
jgi:ParB family chromosome partitioning protein